MVAAAGRVSPRRQKYQPTGIIASAPNSDTIWGHVMLKMNVSSESTRRYETKNRITAYEAKKNVNVRPCRQRNGPAFSQSIAARITRSPSIS